MLASTHASNAEERVAADHDNICRRGMLQMILAQMVTEAAGWQPYPAKYSSAQCA